MPQKTQKGYSSYMLILIIVIGSILVVSGIFYALSKKSVQNENMNSAPEAVSNDEYPDMFSDPSCVGHSA